MLTSDALERIAEASASRLTDQERGHMMDAAAKLAALRARVAELEAAVSAVLERHPSRPDMSGPKPCGCPTCSTLRPVISAGAARCDHAAARARMDGNYTRCECGETVETDASRASARQESGHV